MTGWQDYWGQYVLKITCADTVQFLNTLSDEKIRLKNVEYLGVLQIQVIVSKGDYSKFCVIAEKFGASMEVVHQKGFTQICRAILKRPVLVAATLVFLVASLYLPSRVLFVTVEGNTNIPTKLIIEVAETYGIRFGASRRNIRSEVLKNALLQEIPQLQWAGINTVGCTATISVRERTIINPTEEQKNHVSSIVASRDGIIRSCTIYQGNPLCTVGQAVKAGQTLVSGYVDCGRITKASQAEAEIEALTFHQLNVVTPSADLDRGKIEKKIIRYSVRIGKKLINLYKDSGNLDTSCVKIYLEEYVQLPGGFQLPVVLIKEELIFYEQAEESSALAKKPDWLADFARSHLKSVMIAGQVISEDTRIESDDKGSYLYGKYACTEIIGQIKYEQTILKDEKND